MGPRPKLRDADRREFRLLHAVGISCRRQNLAQRFGIKPGCDETYLRHPRQAVNGVTVVLHFDHGADMMEFVRVFISHGEDKRRGCTMVSL